MIQCSDHGESLAQGLPALLSMFLLEDAPNQTVHARSMYQHHKCHDCLAFS